MPKQRTKAEQEMLCEVWKQSGLTKVEFCKQNNIGEKSFYRWLSKLGIKNKTEIVGIDAAESKNSAAPSPFKFLQINTAASSKDLYSEKCFLEITLPNGISFKADTSQENINNFLQELLKWK
jgi:hypothetical protein